LYKNGYCRSSACSGKYCSDLDPNYNPQTAACSAGTACNDGNYCTINDTYDCDCNCAGTYNLNTIDVANNPPCTVGTPCDDGDICTVNDMYDCFCNCTGEFEGYEEIAGSAIDIGSGGGETYMVGTDNKVYMWDTCEEDWDLLAANPSAERIDVQGDGIPWITATDNKIYRWDGSAFELISGLAIDIGINGNHIFMVGTNNEVYRWNGSGWDKESTLGIAWRIDARPNGSAIVISVDSLNHWHGNDGFFQPWNKGEFKAIDASAPVDNYDFYCLSKDGVAHQYVGNGNYNPVGGYDGLSYSYGEAGEIWIVKSDGNLLHKRICTQIQDDDFTGIPCDDGLACTPASVYDGNCNCVPTDNLALNGIASMSSVYGAPYGPDKINDNIADNSSLVHTKGDSMYEWVEIDLGINQDIGEVIVHNRTSCCTNRLSNVYVLISDTPFPNNTDLTAAQANADFSYQFGTRYSPLLFNLKLVCNWFVTLSFPLAHILK